MKVNIAQAILKRELENKTRRNPMYSMRAYAKFLGIGIATLSDVLNGKRKLSRSNREKVLLKLNLSPIEQNKFINEHFIKTDEERMLLEESVFQLISKWYYYAILEISFIKNHKATPRWISSVLGINTTEIKDALKTLRDLKLLTIKNNKLVKLVAPITTTKDVPSFAIRKRHKEILLLAEQSLDNDSVDERYFFETTMAIAPANIPEAKKLIQKAMRQISKKLETGNQTEIYSLSCKLFPMKERSLSK